MKPLKPSNTNGFSFPSQTQKRLESRFIVFFSSLISAIEERYFANTKHKSIKDTNWFNKTAVLVGNGHGNVRTLLKPYRTIFDKSPPSN